MTGRGFDLIGVTETEILNGADANNIITQDGFHLDSEADQKALKDGIKYKGIKWID